jgi:MraZ protein
VFKGTYRYRIDPKGRLPVPPAFRESLVEGVVLTPLDQCLAAYPASEWSRLEVQLGELPAFSKPVKALTRLLTSRASDAVLDVQGRILLPPALRTGARLEREAIVVGVLNRFEVWSPVAWDAFVRDSERLLDDVALEVQWPLPPRTTPVSVPPAPPDDPRPQAKLKR